MEPTFLALSGFCSHFSGSFADFSSAWQPLHTGVPLIYIFIPHSFPKLQSFSWCYILDSKWTSQTQNVHNWSFPQSGWQLQLLWQEKPCSYFLFFFSSDLASNSAEKCGGYNFKMYLDSSPSSLHHPCLSQHRLYLDYSENLVFLMLPYRLLSTQQPDWSF